MKEILGRMFYYQYATGFWKCKSESEGDGGMAREFLHHAGVGIRMDVVDLGFGSLGGGTARARLPGPDDGVRAAGNLELDEDSGDVIPDSLRTEHKLMGNILVAPAPGHEVEHFPLALGQLRKRVRWQC